MGKSNSPILQATSLNKERSLFFKNSFLCLQSKKCDVVARSDVTVIIMNCM